MDNKEFNLRNKEIREYHSIIIGSGAAGLNCAIHLVEEGIENSQIAIITEQLGGGTSFNAGSDKQTYYKMAIHGKELDSPLELARDLCKGGSMHGDIALVEATNSIREFFHLIHLGVPFPHDKFGGFVGYKTDNDPRQRATSIGPLTSREMCNCLVKQIQEYKIPIHDKTYVFRILTDNSRNPPEALGLLAFKMDELKEFLNIENLINNIKIYKTENIILATGGPAQLYKNSVYPPSQWGSTGLAIQAGVVLQNLTESQFGLASIKFRWNLSGSYQQVIPRYYSIDENGKEHEFLEQYFPSFKLLSRAIFLKGYQWPFNAERIENHGSSLIDLAVYHETETLGRKVYLDYTKNPNGFNIEKLDPIAFDYLNKSNALAKTPIERLLKLNEDAYVLYLDHDIDLKKEPIEIAVCNQHLNGGISGNIWWESISVKHLFAIGEVNGSHGIHRPGGSALNSGQVGGLRVAQKIGHVYNSITKNKELFTWIAQKELDQLFLEINPLFEKNSKKFSNNINDLSRQRNHLTFFLNQLREIMEKYGGIIRPLEGLEEKIKLLKHWYINFNQIVSLESNKDLIRYFKIKNSLLMELFILTSILEYHHANGRSRGSYIIIRDTLNPIHAEEKIIPCEQLQQYGFIKSKRNLNNKILTVSLDSSRNNSIDPLPIKCEWVNVRPIPEISSWFENTWKDFVQNKIFD
ncbi:MAG: FAD-binding protein [Promethearchaeota archaeon]